MAVAMRLFGATRRSGVDKLTVETFIAETNHSRFDHLQHARLWQR